MDRREIRGVFCPVATPLADGDIDTESLARQIDRLVAAGMDGLVVCGTTGEFASLTEDERAAIVRLAVENTPSDVSIIAGGASTSVAGAVDRIQAMTQRGVDSVLLPPPFFHGANDPQGVTRFFEAVFDRVAADVVLYNIPQYTGGDIPRVTVTELAERERVVALKQSGGDLGYALDIEDGTNEEFAVLVGSDRLLGSGLAAGLAGGVNGLSNVVPGTFRELYAAASAGETAVVGEIYRERIGPLRELCGEYGYVPAIKAILSERDVFATEEVRPPLVAPADDIAGRIPELD